MYRENKDLKEIIYEEAKNNLLIPLGVDKNKKVIFIQDTIENEKYYCVECEGELVTRKGKIRVHHFAHKTLTECTGEGIIHKYCKYKIAENGYIRNNKGEKINFKSYEIEKKIGKFYADVYIITEHNIPIIIEIEVTHANTQEKIEYYRDQFLPYINIKIPKYSLLDEIDLYLDSFKINYVTFNYNQEFY